MNKRLNKAAQGGFTLIELIVVIVVLGILAATALPKFANMGGDAREATLRAAAGSLGSVAATIHGKSLADPGKTQFTIEGTTVLLEKGYPKADADTATAAGLNAADYTVIAANHTGDDTSPTTAAGQIAIVPTAIANTAAATKCYVTYKEAASTTTPPVIGIPATMTAANCQ